MIVFFLESTSELFSNIYKQPNSKDINRELDISNLLEGDKNELQLFAHLVTDWVYNAVYSYVLNKEDAEELTQDVIMAALHALNGFKSESSLKTWVYSIAINKSKDFLKYKTRKKRQGKVVSMYNHEGETINIEATEFLHPGIKLESKEQMEIMFMGINSLPDNQKTALIMAKLDHKSQAEIAIIMDISTKAVESLLSRAKANLRLFLEKEGILMYRKLKVK